MIPQKIKGFNAIINGGENSKLPSLTVRQKNNVFQSSWEPTPQELELLNNGGRVILSCLAIQPFVAINVIETDLVYEDYLSPYTPKREEEEEDWPNVKKKRRGRPKKVKSI